jgi:tetratricopeptide (TPR) repeat protein
MKKCDRQNEIDSLYDNKKFIECLQKCNRILSTIDRDDESNSNTLFNCYIRLGNIYAALDQYNNGLRMAHQAILYQSTFEDEMRVNWTISCCYIKKDIDKAVNYIDKVIERASMIEDYPYLYQALVHKAYLINDENLMIEGISNCEKLNLNQKRMDTLYCDMFEMYMNMNNLLKAEKVIKKISNRSYKECLHERIFQLSNLIG